MNFLKAHWGKLTTFGVAALLALIGFSQHNPTPETYGAVEVSLPPLGELLPFLGAAATVISGTVVTLVRATRGPTIAGAELDELFAELASRAWKKNGVELLTDLNTLKGKFSK